MSGKAIILGAKGRFGRAATTAFVSAGWRVRGFARNWEGFRPPAGVQPVTGDAFSETDLTEAAKGCDVIVNAVNFPYHHWARDLQRSTAAVIHAAKACGATVEIPGNVYNYGEGMPVLITEATPHHPTTRKGRLREEMEQTYARAAAEGVRTIILRAGDFIEREKTGNWFDSQIIAKIATGKVMYPGPLDCVHAWAYLPDMARAMVGLAAKRDEFASFETFGFAGFSLTGRQLVDSMERVLRRELKITKAPWFFIRMMGLVSPLMREVAEMAYLWHVPHAIDGSKLSRALAEFRPTSLDDAMADALGVASAAAPVAPPIRGFPEEARSQG